MRTCSTLIFVCENPAAGSAFRASLRDTGFQVLAADNMGSAVTCSGNEPVDGVLIYQDDVRLGNIIGCEMKSLFPSTPVVLISTGFETMAPPLGVDATCYTNSLDDEMARVIAMLFRNWLIQGPCSTNAILEHVDERPRPFVLQRP